MTEEEKKAIEYNLKQLEDSYELHGRDWAKNAINEALNLIQKQQEEIENYEKTIDNLIKEQKEREKYTHSLENVLEKKDKIIDKMAEYIRVDDIEENDNIDLCDFLGKSYSDCKRLSIACEDCIKEYFESKV